MNKVDQEGREIVAQEIRTHGPTTRNENTIILLFNGNEVKYIRMSYISNDRGDGNVTPKAVGEQIIDYWISQPTIEMINRPDSESYCKGVNEIWFDTEKRRDYVCIRYVRRYKNGIDVSMELLIPNHLVQVIQVHNPFTI